MTPTIWNFNLSTRVLTFTVSVALVLASVTIGDEADSKTAAKNAKTALQEFNPLIGGWRGVGMPKRGSATGAWSEKAEWVWNFEKGHVAIQYNVKNSKLLDKALLTFDPATANYNLLANFTDKAVRRYSGKLNGRKLVLESKADKSGDVYRITINRLNDKRTLVLHERRRPNSGFYFRIAEVGYTRAGTSLAIEGAGEPVCVVTGGKGTTRVMYKGQTYYVCCSGCKQAFDDDPEGVIAEYKKKLAKQKADKKNRP